MHSPVERPTDGRPIHTLTLEVQPDDVIGGFHVHFAVYLHYLERAATSHMEAIGFPMQRTMDTLRCWFVARHLEVEYLGAAMAGDTLAIATWIESAGGASIVRCTEICNANTGQRLVVSRVTWVWVDETVRPRRIPREIADGLLPSRTADQSPVDAI